MISAVVLVTTALVWPIHVLGGQIPVVDGVIGGIPSTPNALEDSVIESTSASAPTPGKLRVTENSGICGMCHTRWLLSHEASTDDFTFVQKRRRVYIKLLDTVISQRTRVYGA